VVDDGSTDDTASYLSTAVADFPFPMRVVSHPNQGVSFSRNCGIRLASGEVVAFTDDDCLLPPDWIAQLRQHWLHAPQMIGGIGGPLDTVFDGEGSRVANYLRYVDEFNHVPVLTRIAVRPLHVSRYTGNERIAYLRTANASFRRRCLVEVNGFNEAFRRPGGEDPDLAYRLLAKGYALYFVPTLKVQHRSRPDFRAHFRSLENYVRGEFLNRENRHCYPAGGIRRTFQWIPMQKAIAIALSIVRFPIEIARVARLSRRSGWEMLLFPTVTICSKMIAFWVACSESARLMMKRILIYFAVDE
jgi:glycosyltransferase involved in cell wall biosynthesis